MRGNIKEVQGVRYITGVFTLIELVSILSIISILVSVLLPALSVAQSSLIKTDCANNLRQQGIVMGSYVVDHNNFVMPFNSVKNPPSYGGGEVHRKFYPNILNDMGYLKVDKWYGNNSTWGGAISGIWRCPETEETNLYHGAGYAVNYSHMHGFGESVNLTQLTQPGDYWYMGDVRFYDYGRSVYRTSNIYAFCPKCVGWGSPNISQADPRHLDKTNVVHFDGHVDDYDYLELRANENDIFAHNLNPLK